jgi:DNA-binding winged helix-turn-helix (wHTH) protein/TolB-like protein/Flp pilus assembly protein TadD
MSAERPDEREIHIGEWCLTPSLNLLRHIQTGKRVRLEPRHADLLALFAAHPGEVLSVDDLIGQVWERQMVTDQSVYQAIAKLRRAVNDEASDPRYIETVPKRGYRLIADVRVAEVAAAVADEGPRDEAADEGIQNDAVGKPGGGQIWRIGVAVLVLVVVAAVLTAWWSEWGRQSPTEPDTLTVLILPFKALSDDPRAGFLAEGFAIELAHAVGRVDGVRVIGAVSSQLVTQMDATNGSPAVHVDADVVVTGSLQRDDSGLRIIANLTDVATGHQQWSDVFDRPERDILQTQRDVAEAISEALDRSINPDQLASSLVPDEQQVYDNYLLGRYYRKRRTADDLERAANYFDLALASQPGFLPAMRGRAVTYLLMSFYGSMPLAEALERAKPYLERGLTVAPDDAELLAAVGLSHHLKGSQGIAEDFLMRAVATHPNLAEAWMWLGLTRQQQGRLREALPAFEHASGLEPLLVTAMVNYAYALTAAGQPETALALLEGLATKANEAFVNRDQLFRALSVIERERGNLLEAHHWGMRSLQVTPEAALPRANLAIVYGLLGQHERAKQFAIEALDDGIPGTAVRDFLTRAALATPAVLELVAWEDRVEAMKSSVDSPPIEWRQISLFAGMKAFFAGDFAAALPLLQRATKDNSFPVLGEDDDIFVCGSIVLALRKTGADDAAAPKLDGCRQDLVEARTLGWGSRSLMMGATRLAILAGDRDEAGRLMSQFYDAGFRNLSLLAIDPLFQELASTDVHQQLEARIRADIDSSWRVIAGGD